MAKQHGKDTFVSLNGVNLSAFCNQCTYGRTVDSHDTTTFGNSTHVYNQGLLDGTISLEGFYETVAVATGPRPTIIPLLTATTTPSFIHGPQGSTTGNPKDTCLVNVTKYDESSPVADMVTWTCELQMTGPVVTGTF